MKTKHLNILDNSFKKSTRPFLRAYTSYFEEFLYIGREFFVSNEIPLQIKTIHSDSVVYVYAYVAQEWKPF